MTSAARSAIIHLGMCIGLAQPLSSQSPIMISDRPSCADCRVQRVNLATLGNETGMGFVSIPAGIARFRGMWILTHAAKPGSFSLYGDNAEFIRDVGQVGNGPGEFRFASRILADGDSVFVYDTELRRLQVFSQDMKLVRTFTSEIPVHEIHAHPSGRFIVLADHVARGRAAYPIHVINREGGVERSFGMEPPKRDPKAPRAHRRVVTVAADGTVWTGRFGEYVIEQWDFNGKKLRELRADAPFFPPYFANTVVSPTAPPAAYMGGIWFDDSGRLWVAVTVGDPNWKDAVAPSKAGAYNAFRVTDENRFRDTIIDVIDVRTGELMARARMDDWYSAASIGGLALTVGEKPDGTQTIAIWRPQLTQGKR